MTVTLLSVSSSEHRRFLPYAEDVGVLSGSMHLVPAMVELLTARMVSAGYPRRSLVWSAVPLVEVPLCQSPSLPSSSVQRGPATLPL